MFDSDYILPFFSAKIPPRGYALVGMTDFFDSLRLPRQSEPVYRLSISVCIPFPRIWLRFCEVCHFGCVKAFFMLRLGCEIMTEIR